MSALDVKRLAGGEPRDVGGTPDIPEPPRRWKTRVGLPVAILALTLVLLFVAAWESLWPATPVTVVPVLAKTSEGAREAVVLAAGWVEPDPFPYYVPALASGTVAEVLALEGQSVTKGQVVATLVSADSELALAGAEADLSLSLSELEQAQADRDASHEILDNRVERNRELKGRTARVAELEASLERLTAEIKAATAVLASIEDELQRKRRLVESGAVSRGEFRRLELAFKAQTAVVQATEGRRPVLERQLERARADREAATLHAQLLIEERHSVRVGEAALAASRAAVRRATVACDEARLRLDRMQVRTPVGGVVLRRLVAPGSRLVTGGAEHAAHVVHVYDPQKLQVRVDVPLADAAFVGVDQTAEIEVEVLPDRIFRGRSVRVVHEADIQKNTVEVKVAIEDPSPELKPEMLARVRFLARDPGDVPRRRQILIPDAALRHGDGTATVAVVAEREGQRGIVEWRTVAAGGLQRNGWREVRDGLRLGDWIVYPVPAGLAAGARVEVVGESDVAEKR